jgi:hypothetical protein
MHTLIRCLAVAAGIAASIAAQNQTILFTGRFPFQSLDTPNERVGGAITRLEEFDFSHNTPGTGAVARTLLPATAMQAYLGDGNNDGNYTKFAGWKTYFQNIGVGGIFVKASDRAAVTADDVFFTVRRGTGITQQLEVLTANGTVPYTLVPGDYVRLLPNGNVEFFLTAAQLQIAVGAQSGAGSIGAGALLQAANGDLFYAPVDGGHWVNGMATGTAFAQDGALLKIDAVNITYDANGNVQSLLPNSARLLVNESLGGPGGTLTVRQMTLNSGAVDRNGNALVATSYGKTVGLAFDPNGGTFQTIWPDAGGNYTQEPNLVFTSDAGAYAGTLFSTAATGSVAVLNGVTCGSTTVGVPANGAWLGVQLDIANFQPSMMGFTLCDSLAYQPLVVDQNGFGSLPVAATQPSWDVDVFTTPFTPVFLFLSTGPTGPGAFVPSVPTAFVPLTFTADSWYDVFLLNGPFSLGLAVTDPFGYGTVSVPNPNTGGLTGFTLLVQGIALQPAGFQLSSPMLVQLQ